MCGSASLADKNAEQRSDAAAPAKTKLFRQRSNRSFGTYLRKQIDNHESVSNECYAEEEKGGVAPHSRQCECVRRRKPVRRRPKEKVERSQVGKLE